MNDILYGKATTLLPIEDMPKGLKDFAKSLNKKLDDIPKEDRNTFVEARKAQTKNDIQSANDNYNKLLAKNEYNNNSVIEYNKSLLNKQK